ncbi:MAG TPA: cytochrome c1 [Alcanivoracaceae bacterium]|nr:cytochrome c1 [Alcanivoracaceae bacterium]
MRQLSVVLLGAIALLLSPVSMAENMHKANIDISDKVSQQRGAQIFVNNCMGCHSLQFLRYGRMAEDLNMPEDLVLQNLNFVSEQIGDTMENAMPKKAAEEWFGAAPPDLSLVARLRTPDWVYSYLIGFYEDESRPYGYNNHVFPMVGMPHVLAGMEEELGEEGFREAMLDLTNFLVYAAEPIQERRKELGIYVLLFLAILLIPTYLLKREYWQDVK